MDEITPPDLDGLTTCWPAKKQLHQSELHLSSLLKASHACFMTLDQNGLMYGVSSQLSSLLNFQNEEICGLKFLDLITEDFYNEVNEMIKKVQTDRGWMSMQIPMYTKDAIKVDTVLHMIACTKNNVHAEEVYVVFEPESTLSRERAETSLWMQLGTPTAEMDVNGKITGWNAQMMDLSGFSKEDMIGRSFLDLFSVDALQKVRRTLRLSREVAGVSTCRTTLYTISGFPHLIRLHIMACRDEVGQLVRTAVAAEQIDEDKAKSESIADLPTADDFNNVISDTSDDSCDE